MVTIYTKTRRYFIIKNIFSLLCSAVKVIKAIPLITLSLGVSK
jgi:hypothetical protein